MQYLRVNNQIRVPRVQLIDEEGKQLGTVDTYEALRLARDRNLDLVEVNPKAVPPLCKIMDYGKYEYRKAKQERQTKSKQKIGEMKGIRIGLNTSRHDLDVKAHQTAKFFEKGFRVRVELRLRGREKMMGGLALKRIEEFLSLLGPVTVEQPPKRMPQGFLLTVAKGK